MFATTGQYRGVIVRIKELKFSKKKDVTRETMKEMRRSVKSESFHILWTVFINIGVKNEAFLGYIYSVLFTEVFKEKGQIKKKCYLKTYLLVVGKWH